MIKKNILITVFILGFMVMSGTAFASQISLFVLNGCQHCANVEKYIEDNKITSKLDIKMYELAGNEENRKLYNQKAEEVGYSGGQVPLMITDSKYLVGDTSIISYLEAALSQSEAIVAEPEKTAVLQEVTPANEEPAEAAQVEDLAARGGLTNSDQADLKSIINENTDILPPINLPKKNLIYLLGAAALILLAVTFAKFRTSKSRKHK